MLNSHKKWLVILASVLICAFTIVGCTGKTNEPADTAGEKPAEPIVLKLAAGAPGASTVGKADDFFAKKIEEKSNGAIKVEFYPGGALVGDPDIVDGLMNGNIDMGHWMIGYVTPIIKELTPFEVPGGFPAESYREYDAATHAAVERAFAKYGIKYLGPWHTSNTVFVATKKVGKPIGKPDDLKGKSIRTAGAWEGKFMSAFGGSPVTIPSGELPTVMQRGTIDVAYASWMIVGSMKLYESAPYVTMTDFNNGLVGVAMSQSSFDKLSAEHQQIVLDAFKEAQDYNVELVATDKENFINAVKAANGEVLTLTVEQNAAFKQVSKQLVAEAGKLGGQIGEELAKAFDTVK